MVRMQGDLGKPPEKRLNYKHCFDALFRVSTFPVEMCSAAVLRPTQIRWSERRACHHWLAV